jgi:hypothetical protein
MSIYIGLGMAIPGHEAANFTRKQDSLHALVVKRERSKQSLPYLLATQFCAGTVFGEDGEGVSAGVPQCLKAAIEQGFENVTVVRVQSHPDVLLLVVHNAFGCGDERAANADAGQHPAELEAEDVEEEVDMTRKVFVLVHAALTESDVSGEVCFLPDAAAFFKVAAVAFTASSASTSSGRRASAAAETSACSDTHRGRLSWVEIGSVSAETSACSATHRGGRALVTIMSASVKAARAFAAVKAARTFACEGRVQIASTVDRSNIAGLVERVVDSARVDHGRGRAWAVLRAMTTLLVTGHAAQNKRKISVHQEPLILKACSSAF